MAEFDERWKRLVSAARRVEEPIADLSARRIAELARGRPAPRSYARLERQSLAALAALAACGLLGIALFRAEVGQFFEEARAELVALPKRVPRPPQPPPAALALAALPDLHSLLDLTSPSAENHP